MTATNKTEIRRTMRARRKALTSEERARSAAIVNGKLVASFRKRGMRGEIIAAYLASPDEIDLSETIEALLDGGATVVAPRWNGETYELAKLASLRMEDLRRGPMGILEPMGAEIFPPSRVRVWLVPGLAFAGSGARLGYGGGWYDRMMAGADKRARKLGIAYSFQVVECLPSEPHDICLDAVVDDSPALTEGRG